MSFHNMHRGRPFRLPRSRGRRGRSRGKPSVFTLLVFAVILFVSWWEQRPQRMEGRVLHVQDGDSFVMIHEGEERVVRLFAIDAPENGQAFGAEARRFLQEAIGGKNVLLDVRDTDRYNRLVAEVRVSEEGPSLNRQLVEEGLAWWYRSRRPGVGGYRTLEQEAREAGRGLWQDPNPLAPWDFRRELRQD